MAPRLLVAWVAASLVGCGGTDVAQAGAAPSAAASERASTLAPALGAAGALAHAAAGPSALPSEHAGQAAVPIATVPAAAAAAAAPSPSPLHASSSSAILHADVEMEEAHADEAATHESEHLALEVSVLILLLGASLAVGAVIHSYHITWLPESGATILIGLAFGLIVNAIEPSEKSIERKLYFDPHFFNLFLLPPIIFESGCVRARLGARALAGPPRGATCGVRARRRDQTVAVRAYRTARAARAPTVRRARLAAPRRIPQLRARPVPLLPQPWRDLDVCGLGHAHLNRLHVGGCL